MRWKYVLNFVIVFVFTFSLGAQVFAQSPSARLVNEIYFNLEGQIWTQYDYQLFLQTLKNRNFDSYVPKRSNEEWFLLSRMFYLQTIDLGLSDKAKTNYMDSSLASETERMKSVWEFLEIKDKQVRDTEKVQLWIDFLKKKYRFVPKNDLFKKFAI